MLSMLLCYNYAWLITAIPEEPQLENSLYGRCAIPLMRRCFRCHCEFEYVFELL